MRRDNLKKVECMTCTNSTEFYSKIFEMINPVMWCGMPRTKNVEKWTFCSKCHALFDIEDLERDILLDANSVVLCTL